MNIESVCTRDVATVDRDAPLRAAAQVMLDRHVGALVVTAAGGTRVAGVITDRDIAVEALARELDAGRASVGDLASGRAVAIPASASIGDAIATMREEGLRRLLVTDGRGRLAGIVTLDDLAVRTGDAEMAKRITSQVAKAALPDYFFHQRGG